MCAITLQHAIAEPLVREPLGRDEQQVDLVVREALDDRLELIGVRGVDRLGSDADAPGHLDLVAHQREQRGDEQRRTGALLAQQLRRDEVDGRLPPPRALHEQHPPPVARDRLDRVELARPERGVGAEHVVQVIERCRGHARTVPSAWTGTLLGEVVGGG